MSKKEDVQERDLSFPMVGCLDHFFRKRIFKVTKDPGQAAENQKKAVIDAFFTIWDVISPK